MEINFFVFILHTIPEWIGIIFFTLVLYNSLIEYWRKGIILALIMAAMTYVLRLFIPVTFGLHSLALIALAVVVFRIKLKFDYVFLIKGILSSSFIIILGELLSHFLFVSILNIPMNEILNNTFFLLMFGWIPIIILLTIIVLLHTKKILVLKKR